MAQFMKELGVRGNLMDGDECCGRGEVSGLDGGKTASFMEIVESLTKMDWLRAKAGLSTAGKKEGSKVTIVNLSTGKWEMNTL